MPTETVQVTQTFLEMTARPSLPRPNALFRTPVALLKAEEPPLWWFLALYDAVGSAYHWTDCHRMNQAALEAWVRDPAVSIHTLIRGGWPAGFFMLDRRTEVRCNIAYFGMVPEAVGEGLGKYLLQTAIHTAWDGDGVGTVTVDTCTLDHPRALPLYQRMGFVPVRQEVYDREITQPE